MLFDFLLQLPVHDLKISSKGIQTFDCFVIYLFLHLSSSEIFYDARIQQYSNKNVFIISYIYTISLYTHYLTLLSFPNKSDGFIPRQRRRVFRRESRESERHQNRRETATLGASTCPTWTSTMSLNSSLRGPESKLTPSVRDITLSYKSQPDLRANGNQTLRTDGAASRDWLHYRYARLASQ